MSGESTNTFPCAYDLSDYVHNGQYNPQLHTNTSLVNEVNTIPAAESNSDHGTISIGIDCNLDRYLNCPFGTLAQGTFLDLNTEEKSGLAHAIAHQCIGSSDTTLPDTNSNGGKQRVRVEKKSQRRASGPYYNHERFSSGPGDNFSPHQKASHLLEVPTVDTRLKAHVLTRALSHVQPPTRLPSMPWYQHPLHPQPGAQGTEAQSYPSHSSQVPYGLYEWQFSHHPQAAYFPNDTDSSSRGATFACGSQTLAHQPAAGRVDSLSDGSQLATADPDLTVRTQKSLPEERRQAHLDAVRRTRKEINEGLKALYAILQQTNKLIEDQMPPGTVLEMPILPTTKRPSNLKVIQEAKKRIELLRAKLTSLKEEIRRLQPNSRLVCESSDTRLKRSQSLPVPSPYWNK